MTQIFIIAAWVAYMILNAGVIYPDSKLTLGQCWANVTGYIGPTLANDIGPMQFCSSAQRHIQRWPHMLGQRWHNVEYVIILHITNVDPMLGQRLRNVGSTLTQYWFDVAVTFGQ